jgi:hypothetical protein
MILLFLILYLNVSHISCFIVKDDFLSCKITGKLFTCSDLNCKNSNINNLRDFEDKFHLISLLNMSVVYSFNKQLYLCDCLIIKEIVVPEELEINSKCIKDIYVHFNNKSGFLTFNGIIRERTSMISCNEQTYFYYSLSRKTQFEKYKNKIGFNQIEALKYEVGPNNKGELLLLDT